MPSQTHSTLDSGHSTPPSNDEVLVRVEGVSKKFCRSLKKSLWYGVCDIASELNPFGRTAAFSNSHKNLTTDGSDGHGYGTAVRNQRADSAEFLEGHSQAGLQMDSEKLASIRSANAASGSLENSSSVLISEISGKKSSSALDSGPSTLDSTHGLRAGEFFAVKDVSFELRRGECLGLIGHNGAGKTTLLKMLNGLIKPDSGSITMRGRVGALIALGAGFNPILTGRENIYINGSVLGLTKKEIDAKIDEIIDFAEIREFIDTPVQNYSSGMQVRLGFAVATTLDPDVLILDEVLAVGDVAFRAKCFQRIGRIMDKCCVIFVSHDPIQVSRICDLCLYLNRGETLAMGATEEILELYRQDQPVNYHNSINLDNSVKKFECILQEKNANWGDRLNLTINLEMFDEVKSGLGLIAIQDGELSVAQFEITQEINSGLAAKKTINLTLGPLHLRNGNYGITVTVLNESRKGTLVHALNCVFINFLGPIGYGVPYQFPISATN